MRYTRAQVQSRIQEIPAIEHDQTGRLSAYAGLAVLIPLVKALDLTRRLRLALDRPGDSAAYSMSRLFWLLTLLQLTGWRRLDDLDWLRNDPVVARAAGLKVLPAATTLTRRLRSLDDDAIAKVDKVREQLVLERLTKEQLSVVTLDCDGSVQSHKGHAEGTAIGFNKVKKGARSYYPLFVTVAQTSQVLKVHHRSGNTHDSRGALDVVLQAVADVREALPNARIETRQDSAFYSKETANGLGRAGVFFTISVAFNRFPELKRLIEERKRWRRIDADWSFFEYSNKPNGWDKPGRFILVRQRHPKQKKEPLQLDLFEPVHHVYRYTVIVTNDRDRDTDAAEIIARHHGRGSQEKLFGEAKQHAALDVIASKFQAFNRLFTLASVLAVNLGRELELHLTNKRRPQGVKRAAILPFRTLGTLQKELFQRPGRITRPQGKLTLMVGPNTRTSAAIRSAVEAIGRSVA